MRVKCLFSYYKLKNRKLFLQNTINYGNVTASKSTGPAPDMTNIEGLPHFARGVVIRGFGRGSKELGIPTANFDEDVVNNLPKEIKTGVYYGFAQVDQGPVYKMVMNLGWNPFYNNTQKSMETHILHKFEEDFYGKMLKIVMLGYLRPEKNFNSLNELIDAINGDIADAEIALNEDLLQMYINHDFFNSQ